MEETSLTRTDLLHAVLFLIPVAAVIGLFTFLAVVGVARERRREREAFYRHQTALKLIETQQMTGEQFAAFERAEAERPVSARRRALFMAGGVLFLGGLALYWACIEMNPAIWPELRELAHLGAVPIAIGGALLLHATASFLHAAATARARRQG